MAVRELVGVATRLRSDLRVALAERYRTALARRSRAVVLVVAVAGLVDRVAGAARFVRSLRGGRRGLTDRIVALRRRRGVPGALTLVRAAVGGCDELSLACTAPAAISPTTVRLVRGPEVHDLETVVTRSGSTVWLVAVVPESLCTGQPWHVHVVDDRGRLPVLTPDRSVLSHRDDAAFDATAWPPRLALDADRELVLDGRAPADPARAPRVGVGITTVTVAWAGAAEQLRLTSADGRTVDVAATADGARAVVDLTGLAAGRWTLAVGDGEAWVPLALTPGAFPSLADAPAAPGVALVRPDAPAVQVRVGYGPVNELTVTVEARS